MNEIEIKNGFWYIYLDNDGNVVENEKDATLIVRQDVSGKKIVSNLCFRFKKSQGWTSYDQILSISNKNLRNGVNGLWGPLEKVCQAAYGLVQEGLDNPFLVRREEREPRVIGGVLSYADAKTTGSSHWLMYGGKSNPIVNVTMANMTASDGDYEFFIKAMLSSMRGSRDRVISGLCETYSDDFDLLAEISLCSDHLFNYEDDESTGHLIGAIYAELENNDNVFEKDYLLKVFGIISDPATIVKRFSDWDDVFPKIFMEFLEYDLEKAVKVLWEKDKEIVARFVRENYFRNPEVKLLGSEEEVSMDYKAKVVGRIIKELAKDTKEYCSVVQLSLSAPENKVDNYWMTCANIGAFGDDYDDFIAIQKDTLALDREKSGMYGALIEQYEGDIVRAFLSHIGIYEDSLSLQLKHEIVLSDIIIPFVIIDKVYDDRCYSVISSYLRKRYGVGDGNPSEEVTRHMGEDLKKGIERSSRGSVLPKNFQELIINEILTEPSPCLIDIFLKATS